MSDTIPENHSTGEGATLSEAVNDGAQKLGLDPAEVHYKIDLSHFRTAEGRNVGVDTVKVLVWARDGQELVASHEVRDWMTSLLDHMGFESKVACEASGNRLLIRVRTPNGGRLVGREGATLDAVRTLLEAHLASHLPDWKFDIDVEDNRPRPSRDERDGREGPGDEPRGDRGPRRFEREDRGPRDRDPRSEHHGDRRSDPRTEHHGDRHGDPRAEHHGDRHSEPRAEHHDDRHGEPRAEHHDDRHGGHHDERHGDQRRGPPGEYQGERRTDEDHLREMTRKMAMRVIESGTAETTPPLNSYARRIVHLAITEFPNLQSESVGEGPHKKIRVAPLADREREIERVDTEIDPESPTGSQD